MRSNFERDFAAFLDRSKIAYEYEPETLTYTRQYIPDFKITTRTGKVIYIETKGHLKSSDRTKLLAVRRDNPGIDLRIVFQRSKEKLNRNSTTTYGEWATANNFKWADGVLPKAWIDE